MRIFSCVSGTSCDGISWAVVDVSERKGRVIFDLVSKGNSDYSIELKRSLLEAANSGKADLSELCDMHWSIGKHLVRIARKIPSGIDASVFSGHTIYHTEQVGKTGMGTFQIGAVEPLSVFLEVPVIRDMRSTDVAAGGMGAPLVPRADELMFGRGSAVLNMGGIANLTLLGPRTTGFDTGPGNMLIDEASRLLFGKEFDRNGSIARSGKHDSRILSSLLKDPFVNSRPPKSCGRERYGTAFLNRVVSRASSFGIGNEDIMATLSEFTVRSILRNMKRYAPGFRKLICAGGGAYNDYLMERMAELFDGKVFTSDEFGVPRDSRESIAFALLCYLSLQLKASNSDATGAKKKLPLGSVTLCGFGGKPAGIMR